MREIHFKGKRISDGQWFEGCYERGPGDVIRIKWWNQSYHVVAESTVGQYIGLQDKKGYKIFEGDILTNAGGIYREVYYNTDTAQFRIRDFPFDPMTGNDTIFGYNAEDIHSFGYEIVGNIHDDPDEVKHG